MTPELIEEGRSAFAEHVRPRLAQLLSAIGLDRVYQRGDRDYLYYCRDGDGREVQVLDVLGGFGASLFGHNHPELVSTAREVLDAQRPFHAQASSRALAGLLAKRLSERVGRSTGRSYVATFANSGTEAVEAALKHAQMERAAQHARRVEELKERIRLIRLRLREQTAYVPPDLFSSAARLLGVAKIDGLDELFARVFRTVLDATEREPIFLAVERAFHGKTTGALKLTYNPSYRAPWLTAGLRTAFLPPEEPAAIEAEVERARVPFLDLQLKTDGALAVVPSSFVNVTGCFVEPLQGEGGIHPLSPAYLQALRTAADRDGFPLIIDEIQSGMGRTGTFLSLEPSEVRGDYYLFSKALGGGLAKISALLVDRERYVHEFGWQHTSTFADDDFSSAIGLKVLELLDRGNGDLIAACREKGERLMAALQALQRKYPEQLQGVRGRGLMLGLELAVGAESSSPLLSVLGEQKLLGFVVSGYLLHEERIRVAPTLSAHGTLRIQPSAYIEPAEMDRLCAAIERVLELLRSGDAYRLCRFMAGASGPAAAASAPAALPQARRDQRPDARHVGFLVHFMEPGDIREWERSFAPLSDAQCARFLDRTQGLLDPFVVERAPLRSASGENVDLTVIAVPFTPAQVMDALRSGQAEWALDLVKKAVELARGLGCSVVGFGGYTSIVTDNCRAIIEDQMSLTSGNALTTAAAVEALLQAAQRRGLSELRVGIVGAAGNIGAVLAEVLSDRVARLVLVGRPGAGTVRRLEQTAREVYAAAWRRLLAEKAPGGLAAAIAGTQTFRELKAGDDAGERLRVGLQAELGEDAPIRIVTDMEALRQCNAIVSATNSPRPVVLPAHVGEGPVILCDVAVPRDVDPSVAEQRPEATILKGGTVHAPFGQALGISAVRLDPGQLYGCLAESLVLGFAGLREHFSYGKLTAARVRRIRELALSHGFTLGEKPA